MPVRSIKVVGQYHRSVNMKEPLAGGYLGLRLFAQFAPFVSFVPKKYIIEYTHKNDIPSRARTKLIDVHFHFIHWVIEEGKTSSLSESVRQTKRVR